MDITVVAEKIYSLSITLKSFQYSRLILKHKRIELYNTLFQLRNLVYELQNRLMNNDLYSKKYIELTIFMMVVLSDSMISLFRREKNYKITLQKSLHGFHNLPRAFLRINDKMHISVEDAYNYYDPYVKAD